MTICKHCDSTKSHRMTKDPQYRQALIETGEIRWAQDDYDVCDNCGTIMEVKA